MSDISHNMNNKTSYHHQSSDEEEEEEEAPATDSPDTHQHQHQHQEQQQQELRTEMVLRLHADNLPRHGIRMALPDTYAVVTSVSRRAHDSRNNGPHLHHHFEEDAENNMNGDSSSSNHPNSTIKNDPHRHVLRKKEWGRTEVVRKSCRPQWTTTFPLTYTYGTDCYFVVRLFRRSSRTSIGGSTSSTSRHSKKSSCDSQPGDGADRNDPSSTLDMDDDTEEPEGESLGDAVFEIGDILGSKNHTKIKRLPKGGILFCRLEPMRHNNQNQIVRFQFAATNLLVSRKKRSSLLLSAFSNAPDTIVQISKRHPCASTQAWIVVYRSSPVENSLAPTWDIGQLDLESICNGDWDRPLRLAVLVHRKVAQDVMIGECETTLRMILNTQRDDHSTTAEEEVSRHGFPLQRSMSKPKPVGRLQIRLAQVMDVSAGHEVDPPLFQSSPYDSVSQQEQPGNPSSSSSSSPPCNDPYAIDIAALPIPMAAPATFQDYIDSGWRLDFHVAIDFTSSNGDPRQPGTLHDQNPITLNDYEETMVSIGNAVSPYTQDGSLATTVWGFGCKYDGTLRHIFQCGPDSQVFGVDGILRAYKSVFESDFTMSGPTCFDQVIQAAAVQARRNQQTKLRGYSVLLVVTDGICQDVDETKRKLAVYSTMPLSIVFVGVGRADFGVMYDLVSSPHPISSTSRPNATFVEFRQHQHDPTSLGRSALQQLPGQLVQYMLQHNILPGSSS